MSRIGRLGNGLIGPLKHLHSNSRTGDVVGTHYGTNVGVEGSNWVAKKKFSFSDGIASGASSLLCLFKSSLSSFLFEFHTFVCRLGMQILR